MAFPALAQNATCLPRDVWVQRLGEGYQETRRIVAMLSNNTVLEVFANPETGTFTILVTNVEGVSCAPAAGTNYEETDEALPPEGVEG